jgi:DHA1 family bicyclomycin/chloramphenicol resistance-like MFS transporter
LAAAPHSGDAPRSAHPGDALSGRRRFFYVIILGALVALGPFTIDLYLPAFPVLEDDFDVSAAAIQLTLTGTTIGFALGQLLVGPLSDRVGRRMPIIIASSVHVLACIGAAVAPEIWSLGVFRVVQGMGAAAGGVVAMAMVRDLFGGRRLVVMLSRLALVTGLAPIIAPVIGSQLLLVVDWRGIFWVLAAYGALVVTVVSLCIGETLPREHRNGPGGSTARQRYRSVLTDPVFIGVAIIGGMTFSGLFSYLSASSFLFQNVYGFSAQEFGVLFAVNSLGIVAGTQLSARLTRWYGPQWILAVSTALLFLCASLIAVFSVLGVGLWGTLIPLWFFIAACGLTFPCVQVLALNGHGQAAGTAASLLGAVNFGLAGLISPLVGVLGIDSATPMAAVMGVTAAVGILALWLVVKPRRVPALGH